MFTRREMKLLLESPSTQHAHGTFPKPHHAQACQNSVDALYPQSREAWHPLAQELQMLARA